MAVMVRRLSVRVDGEYKSQRRPGQSGFWPAADGHGEGEYFPSSGSGGP